jgi:hypothetical protein
MAAWEPEIPQRMVAVLQISSIDVCRLIGHANPCLSFHSEQFDGVE